MDTQKFTVISFIIILTVGAVAALLIYMSLKDLTAIDDSTIYITQPRKEIKGLIKPPDNESDGLSLMFVGDIMLGRYVETLMNKNGQHYPFDKLNGLLNEADLTIGNLEGPINSNHLQTPDYSLSFSFSPDIAELLANQGIDIVSLANNHGLDRGESGYNDTVHYLSYAGLDFFGHSTDLDKSVLKTQINSQKINFIGLNAVWAGFNDSSAADLISRYNDSDSITVVFVHWGSEYQLTSNQKQRTQAHLFIEAGADLIIGHHPHVVQEVELYKDKLIFYSLGNFIFDQYFSEDTQRGLAVNIRIRDNQIDHELIPIISTKSQPQLMPQTESDIWFSELAEKSTAVIK